MLKKRLINSSQYHIKTKIFSFFRVNFFKKILIECIQKPFRYYFQHHGKFSTTDLLITCEILVDLVVNDFKRFKSSER